MFFKNFLMNFFPQEEPVVYNTWKHSTGFVCPSCGVSENVFSKTEKPDGLTSNITHKCVVCNYTWFDGGVKGY